jgi:hypothetical protein
VYTPDLTTAHGRGLGFGPEPLEMPWFGRAPTAEKRRNLRARRTLNLPFWIQKLGDLEPRVQDGIQEEEE